MKCPICSNNAKEGGLIADSTFINWAPLNEIQKGALRDMVRIFYPGVTISNRNPFVRVSKVPNAYYCEHCNKVFGIFDVTDSES